MTNKTDYPTSARLDPDYAKHLLKVLECPIGSITHELAASLESPDSLLDEFLKTGHYFNAHYVLNNIRDARRALDKIEAAAKEHQANGHR